MDSTTMAKGSGAATACPAVRSGYAEGDPLAVRVCSMFSAIRSMFFWCIPTTTASFDLIFEKTIRPLPGGNQGAVSRFPIKVVETGHEEIKIPLVFFRVRDALRYVYTKANLHARIAHAFK